MDNARPLGICPAQYEPAEDACVLLLYPNQMTIKIPLGFSLVVFNACLTEPNTISSLPGKIKIFRCNQIMGLR